MRGGGSPAPGLPGGGGAAPPGRPGTDGAGRADGAGGGGRAAELGADLRIPPGEVCGCIDVVLEAASQSFLTGGGAGVPMVAVDTSPMILSASLQA